MTSTVPSDEQLGSPPPFDPELAAALTVLRQRIPASFTADMIGERRAGAAEMRVDPAELRIGGRFEIEEQAVPARRT
ncbi:hypothetical protein [Amycolatopsis alkalitolerans]|uniref:Uncharacterized protein n=1 Tax=Amycolatopsis alkalitolerans TaxID=2547244 RepID=A0A5C4M3T0_9PSEU|nr:hypothetical protein [Amycolatopsis alkalitolerans]TNC27726.1 hypothetical protein FG385_08375 [Amycolatopsis alkalitolerans]